jgi:hypothetical protein
MNSSPSILKAYANSLSISSENQMRIGKLHHTKEILTDMENSMKLVLLGAQFSVDGYQVLRCIKSTRAQEAMSPDFYLVIDCAKCFQLILQFTKCFKSNDKLT